MVNLLKSIHQQDVKNLYFLFSSNPLDTNKFNANFINLTGNKFGSFSNFGFSKLFNEVNCDVAFIPKETVPFFIKKPVVITAYDLFYIKMYKQFKNQIKLSAKLHYELAKLISFKKAEKICAISNNCKQDLIEYCNIKPEKVITTHLGYDPDKFYPRSKEEVLHIKDKYSICNDYFINISSVIWNRKNPLGLLKAYKKIQGSGYPHELIIVGKKGASYIEVLDYIERNQLRAKCLLSVPVEDLAYLLSGATALVYPSFHEGFGLPVIESMAVGCPVITSNTSSMPEVAGDAALLIDPYSSDEIYEAMKKIIEDTHLIDNLVKKGLAWSKSFTWENTTKKTLEVIQSV